MKGLIVRRPRIGVTMAVTALAVCLAYAGVGLAANVKLELHDDGALVSGATFKYSTYAGGGYVPIPSNPFPVAEDDWYFHCTYNGTSVLSGKVTVSADMTYTFQAYDVELQLWDGGVNETGSTTFKFSDYAGGYDPIPSNPLLLLPDAWWFWASFADGTQVKSLTISADDVVRFDTTPVNIRFSGTITYRLGTSGGWNAFTSNGLLPGTYQFQFDSKHTTSITVGTSPINKTAVVLTLKDSAGDPLAGGKARVKDTYWHFVTGVTDAFGKLFELRDGASSSLLYEMKYNNTTQLINQDPGSNSYYDFQTAKAAVKLIDMDDNPLSGGVVSYGVSGGSQWSWPGAATNTVGYTFAELFPGDYYFKMAYGGGSYTMPGKQNISSDVVFQTGRLRWDGTCPEPYRVYGAARFFSDGMDLLPGNCEVDFTGASLNKVFVMVAGAETWTSDKELPTITAPKDETVECIGDVPAAETDVTAFLALPDTALNDNCTVDANLVIEHVGDVSDGNSCPEVITRTYRVQDECFNWSSTDVQLITVDDTTAPTFTRPADTTIYKDASCAYDADPTITGDVTDEDDNCDTSLVATYVDVVAAGSCEGEQIITRTWSLVDDCGNAAADQDQTITVVDTTAPAISDCPSNITQDNDPGVCGAIVTWVEPTAGDNCDPAPALVSTHSPGDYFPVGTTTITYTATDDCGNFSTCLFDVTVLDVEPPTAEFLTAPPNPDYDTRPLFEWTAEDNNDCTAPPELQYRRRLDGGVWTGWSLATSDILGPLSEDWHTFEVEARDEAGNVSIPIIHTWYRATYDVTPPVLPDEDIVGGGGAVGSVAAPGCFFDLEHCLEGGGGEIEGVPLNAVFEVGEPITIQFVVTDVDGELVFDAVAAATFGDITLVDGEEVYAIIGYFHIPYVLELDLYSLLVLTVGEEDDVLALPAGNYIVWIDLNDGTHIEQRIQIVDPIG
ncbi:MAG: HYR domain-containing protein [Candidatus Bipolaricaulia bacterium]